MSNLYLQSLSTSTSHIGHLHQNYPQNPAPQSLSNYLNIIDNNINRNSDDSLAAEAPTSTLSNNTTSPSSGFNSNFNTKQSSVVNKLISSLSSSTTTTGMANESQLKRDKEAILK